MSRMIEDLQRVETPVAVVDLPRARANARRVAEYCAEHGLSWRPHVKTHKSREMARIQLEAGARGLTVATPREAEVMAEVTDDLLLAYPPVGPARLRRILDLPAGTKLRVALDSREALEPLSAAAAAAGRVVGILVEVDVGMGRVGVQDAEAAVELAGAARDLPGVDYRGVLFYPGHIRGPTGEQDAALTELGDALDRLYRTLEGAGLEPEVVSGGSTPTLWRSHELPHLTEIRPGTCIYHDRESVGVGAAEWEDLAYSVLATVVSTTVPGQAVVDAGSKALSREARGADPTYGAVLDRPQVQVRALSEEHGMLDLSRTDWRPRVGERVRIVPNHVCVSVHLQDRLLVVDGEGVDCWELEARGRRREPEERT